MNDFFFIITNLAALWITGRCAASIADSRLDSLIGSIALFPICAVLLMLAAGVTGFLRPLPVTIAAGVLAIAVTPVTRAFPPVEDLRTPQTVRALVALGVAIAFASIPLVRLVTAGTGYFIDDFGYHAVAVAAWVQNHGFTQIMPQFMAYLPLNAELLAAWFALPYHNDTMVTLASVIWLAVAAISAGGLVWRLGGDSTASFWIAAAVLASPPIIWQTRTFAASDLAGTATLLAAAYFSSMAITSQRLSQALAAGLLAGFSAGCKATFLPVVVLISVMPLVIRLPWRTRLSLAGCTSMAVALLGSFWYLRNWSVAGNPLFPAALGPFPGPLTRADQADIKLIGLLAEVPWTFRLWGSMLYDYLDWPLPLGMLAFAGYVRAIAAEWTRPATDDAILRRLLAIGGMSQFVLHLFAPFCLGGGYVDGRILVYSRYIMPWFVFGLALAGPLLAGRSRFGIGWQILAGTGVLICWPTNGVMRFGAAVAALIALAIVAKVPARYWKFLTLAGVFAIWPLLSLLAVQMRSATQKNLREHLKTEGGQSLGEAIHSLESLPPNTSVTRFANHSYFNSPIFGRDWQLNPLFTGVDGHALPPLHEIFHTDPQMRFFDRTRPALPMPQELVANLRADGIRAVFVTKFRSKSWPPQQALLEASGEAILLFDDGASALWLLNPP